MALKSNKWNKVKQLTGKSLPFVIIFVIAFALGARLNEEQLLKNSSNLPGSLDYSSVEELYDSLKKEYDGELTEAALLDGMKKGLVDATGDPYTDYFTAEESQMFYESLNGKFSGIGAELGKQDDQLVVIASLEGFPAEKAGLKGGDVIAAVNGEESVKWTVEHAVSKIRGEEGTEVTLTIERDGKTQDIKIVRAEITIPSVEYEVKDGIGYLQIIRFAEDTEKLTAQAAQDFKTQNVKGVVLDLRSNGGGYLDSAIAVADLWLDSKVVVEERSKSGNTMHSSTKTTPLKDVPTVVLINEGSASASEIVAGALQDHGVAELVGEKSFGKGSVQHFSELNFGGQLKVTVARWFTPNGNNIDQQGITPDKEVKLSEEDAKNKEDKQLDQALNMLK